MAVRRKPMSEINVVPYIDVMLVLLVIFMATAPLFTQGVEVDLPQAPSEALPEEDDPLVVSVRGDGAIFLNIGVRSDDEKGRRVTIFSLEDQATRVIGARPTVAGLRPRRPRDRVRRGGQGHDRPAEGRCRRAWA